MIKLKDIILEATREELVLATSRQIIYAFKRGDAEYTQDFQEHTTILLLRLRKH